MSRFYSTVFFIILLFVQPAFAVTLFGDVEHSDSLPESNDQLKAKNQRPSPDAVQQSIQATPPIPLQGKCSNIGTASH